MLQINTSNFSMLMLNILLAFHLNVKLGYTYFQGQITHALIIFSHMFD